MKLFYNSQSNMAYFGFDKSLSFPTAGQGNRMTLGTRLVSTVPMKTLLSLRMSLVDNLVPVARERGR